mgnify:CR=1 FL=1
MKFEGVYFKRDNSVLGGYLVPVEDEWTKEVRRRRIGEEDKEAYEEAFKKEVISDNDFYHWWKARWKEKHNV